MSTSLPNPFLFSSLEPARAEGTVAGLGLTDRSVPAAENFYRILEEVLALPPIFPLYDNEPAPVFLSDPSDEYADAIELLEAAVAADIPLRSGAMG